MEKFNVSNWEALAEKAIDIMGEVVTECANIRTEARNTAEQILKEHGFYGAFVQTIPGIDCYLIRCSIVVNHVKYTQEKIFKIF